MDRASVQRELPPYQGFRTHVVRIGDLELGGDRPVRIQSMTNTPTLNTAATVAQVADLARAGCELVRITAQNLREAHHLKIIRHELKQLGISVPLAADIHYLPEAAEVAARVVEKVRINPGNYSEKRSGRDMDLSDREYTDELEKIATRLRPLLKVCKEYGTAIRIGTNHGSLSERITFRYGNTPEGMVESALEFARICRDAGFENLVLSMKASDILTVLHANRLLAARMRSEGMDYPIHLGVTEAGDGEDGRIKSAMGIGILLSEGIGDTIRVSLTEDPLNEVPFAAALAAHFNADGLRKILPDIPVSPSPYAFTRSATKEVADIGGSHPPVVIGEGFPTPDYIFKKDHLLNINSKERIHLDPGPSPGSVRIIDSPAEEDALALRKNLIPTVQSGNHLPYILHKDLGVFKDDELLIHAAIDLGMALTDGYGDGILITGGEMESGARVKLAFDILQASRRRISKTEYIACPSCGRTKFDIQEALRRVKEKTSHLVGLKIAVMGCIVNGPGEMADADYGYVGAGPGKVHIYKGHEQIMRNVPQDEAVDLLLQIITQHSEFKN